MASTHSHRRSGLDARLRSFTQACRERRTPVTHQRLAVFRALLEDDSHPDAEALHRSLRDAYPTLSLGTVYKTLEMLQSLGLARPVSSPGPTRRFDGNPHPHHHLWCTRCRRLMDVELDGLADIALPTRLGFRVTDVVIQFNGICADCRKPAARRAPRDRGDGRDAGGAEHARRHGPPRSPGARHPRHPRPVRLRTHRREPHDE
jgi:Fur family peroxide stress response transcriptional regulator